MKRKPNPDRREVLLKAAYDMIDKLIESPIVLECAGETVFYDGVECDGYCLRDELAHELGIER
jgi:hypothetical protein